MPSIAPRKIITTKRWSVGAAASAREARPAAPARLTAELRPSSADRRVSCIIFIAASGLVAVEIVVAASTVPKRSPLNRLLLKLSSLKLGRGQQQGDRIAARAGMAHRC